MISAPAVQRLRLGLSGAGLEAYDRVPGTASRVLEAGEDLRRVPVPAVVGAGPHALYLAGVRALPSVAAAGNRGAVRVEQKQEKPRGRVERPQLPEQRASYACSATLRFSARYAWRYNVRRRSHPSRP